MTGHMIVRRRITVWAVALFLTALSLLVHITAPSSWHQSEDNWRQRMEMHRANDAFRARPFTSAMVEILHDATGWSYRFAFFILQFCLLLISGPVFYTYLRHLAFSFRESLWGMVIYQLSFPVFLAHFDPVYTWSDFWVYLMIPLSLACLIRRWWIPASVLLAGAILARETTLIFVPVWFLFVFRRSKGGLTRAVILSAAALALFAAVRYVMIRTFGGELVYQLPFNLENPARATDTIFSLLVSLGFLWPVGAYQAFRKPSAAHPYSRTIRFGAVLTAVGYIGSTLLLARARETRLFFPPFIFFIPLFLVYFRSRAAVVQEILRRFSPWSLGTILIILMAFSMILSVLLFPGFEFRTWHDGSRLYFGLHVMITLSLLMTHYRRPTDSGKSG